MPVDKTNTQNGELTRHEVVIMDQTYTVLSDAPAERVQEIAEYVDGKLREVLEAGQNISTMRGAILVALNIGEEYFRATDRADAIEMTADRQVRETLKFLDEKGL